LAEYQKPEKIFAIINVDGRKTMYEQEFAQDEEIQKISRESQENLNNLQEFSSKSQTIDPMEHQMIKTEMPFAGFGETSVKKYVEKVLADERREREFIDLQAELLKKKEEIQRLNQQISEFEKNIDETEDKVEKLETELENKKKIRYWAGMTGDILESIGFKKESLRQPLAGILTGEEESPKELQENKTVQQADESGIVEEEHSTKRSELIGLITAYLKEIDDQTLANVFMIFSEIERDKNIAVQIIQQLNIEQ